MRKHVEEMVLWSVPVFAMPAIMDALQKECAKKVRDGEFEEAESALWALRKMNDEYLEKVMEMERLNTPDPEPEEDGGEDE